MSNYKNNRIMKKKGSNCEFSEERNEEIKRLFNKELKRKGSGTISDAMQAVWQSPASRFYISEQRAKAVLRYRENHGVFPGRLQGRLEMYEELWRRYNRKLSENTAADNDDIIFDVVNSPAPSFYLSRRTMRTLIYAINNSASASGR